MEINDLLKLIGDNYITGIRASLTQIGLKDSQIYKDVRYVISNNNINLIIPDYYIFIEKGRKHSTSPPPIKNIIDWMKEKGISAGNKNSIAYKIRAAIAKDGIKARPFLDKGIQIGIELSFDLLEQTINAELEDIFK